MGAKMSKAGTRIEVGLDDGVNETGVILRWTKAMGKREKIPGYHPVSFDSDGAKLMVHESGFRIIDNRAAAGPMPKLTNMPWAVYRCDRIGLGQTPRNEEFVSGHLTAGEAMTEANRLRRGDRKHSYTVGQA